MVRDRQGELRWPDAVTASISGARPGGSISRIGRAPRRAPRQEELESARTRFEPDEPDDGSSKERRPEPILGAQSELPERADGIEGHEACQGPTSRTRRRDVTDKSGIKQTEREKC